MSLSCAVVVLRAPKLVVTCQWPLAYEASANKTIIMLDSCKPEGLWLAGASCEKVVFPF